jgi:hypothetical protein
MSSFILGVASRVHVVQAIEHHGGIFPGVRNCKLEQGLVKEAGPEAQAVRSSLGQG